MNIDQNLKIGSDATVRDAFRRLDETACGVLLLVDDDDRLLRTVTDGDLRRLLLAGRSLESKLDSLPDKDPVVAVAGDELDTIHERMVRNKIRHVPRVDDDGKVVDLVTRDDFEKPILLSIPHMSEFERDYVQEAFESNWVAPLGPNVDGFEREMAEKTGIPHAAALSSGTAALHLALVVLGVGRGDTVFCPSLTFVATANPVFYQGAEPVLIDSAPGSWNMCPESLEAALARYQGMNRLPKAVILVNLYGHSADYREIMPICERYGVPVIEDAAESLGATYRGRASGSFGALAAFSFNGNKIITTSGGGMLVSTDEKYIEQARWLSTQAKDPAPYYLHSTVGYNYRMSNILAGIGRGQLKVLDDRVNRRRELYKRYRSELSRLGIFEWIEELPDSRPTHWLSVALVARTAPVTPDKLITRLSEYGIEARRVWNPLHRQPLFRDCDYHSIHAESVCDDLFERGVCLPSSSNLSDLQQERIIQSLAEIVKA